MANMVLLDTSWVISFTYNNMIDIIFPVLKLERALVLSHFSHVQLFVTLQTIALQAPLSMGIVQARMLE